MDYGHAAKSSVDGHVTPMAFRRGRGVGPFLHTPQGRGNSIGSSYNQPTKTYSTNTELRKEDRSLLGSPMMSQTPGNRGRSFMSRPPRGVSPYSFIASNRGRGRGYDNKPIASNINDENIDHVDTKVEDTRNQNNANKGNLKCIPERHNPHLFWIYILQTC